MELLKPSISSTTRLSNLIFQRKDIYCLLESLVKDIGVNFDDLSSNDQALKDYADTLYNDLLERIARIISGEDIELDFVPKDGSVTINKLAEEVLNLIQSAKCNVEIDSENDILRDTNTGIEYKLVRADAEETIQYGDITITDFEYETNISANGGTMSMTPKVLKFKQEKRIISHDGQVTIDYINGNLLTTSATFIYSIENKPDWFNFFINNGALQVFENPNEQEASAVIKVKVLWNGVTSEEKSFTVVQQAGYFRLNPSSIVRDSKESGLITVDVEASSAFKMINVESDSNWIDAVDFADDKIQVFLNENTESRTRTGTITVTYTGNKTKNINVTQYGKQIETIFYYGGASSFESIPRTTEGLRSTTDNIIEFEFTELDKYRTIFVNVPTGYRLTKVTDRDTDNVEFSTTPINVNGRYIYYTTVGSGYISDKYILTISSNG